MYGLKFSRLVVFAAGVLWLATGAGCNSSEPDPEAEERSSALTSEASETSSEPENVFGEDPSEKLLPDERVRDIDWEEARSYATLDSELVPKSLAQYYEESPVPVLLPADREALETAEPTLGRHWYAAHLEVDGRDVTIEGDRVVRKTDDFLQNAKADGASDDGFVVTQTHGVMSVSFTAFNAAYVVDVECRDVDSRGTCTNESFAVELANRLARLGGRR